MSRVTYSMKQAQLAEFKKQLTIIVRYCIIIRVADERSNTLRNAGF
jgi:hypothetical protein